MQKDIDKIYNMSQNKKRNGMNAVQFIDQLMESPSFKIAVDLFNNGDKSTLRIRMIEWLRHSEDATKTALLKNLIGYESLHQFEYIPLLKKLSKDYDILNWYKLDNTLTDFERKWYIAMVKGDTDLKTELVKELKKGDG